MTWNKTIATLAIIGLCLATPAMAQSLGGATIDEIALTDQELEAYNALQSQKAGLLKQQRNFAEQVLNWIQAEAPTVIQNQAEQAAAEEMYDNFKVLAKRVVAKYSAMEVTGVVIRRATLTQSLAVAQDSVDRAQSAVDDLVAQDPAADQALVDAANVILSDATTARDAAQASLDAFNVTYPVE